MVAFADRWPPNITRGQSLRDLRLLMMAAAESDPDEVGPPPDDEELEELRAWHAGIVAEAEGRAG